MKRPVVVTRPASQATSLAARISAAGGQPIVFPLLNIEPLADDSAMLREAERLADYKMVAFVSPNAIDAFMAAIDRWPSSVMIAVMGQGSRSRLADHGLTDANANIISPKDPLRSDSQTLLETLDLDVLRGAKVLIVRGETGRELLGDALRHAGANVTQVAAYRRSAPTQVDPLGPLLRSLIDGDHDWIITSSEALRNLLDLVSGTGNAEDVLKIQRQRLVVPHIRIKETAALLGFQNILLTGSGDDLLITALQSAP